jgi:hypothetical protein
MSHTRPDLSQAQLFLDDALIEDFGQLTRCWHQAKKARKPVLEADKPWEYGAALLYGTVLRRAGAYHMWYITWTRHIKARVCYAVSDDGMHWRKPELELFEVCGTRKNNVVIESQHPRGYIDNLTVIDDPDDEQWPLKALVWDSCGWNGGAISDFKFGIFAMRSKDGLHWEWMGCGLPLWRDRCNALNARLNGKFALFGRGSAELAAHQRGEIVYRTESEDMLHWSEPRIVLMRDLQDPALMSIYSLAAFPYEGFLLGGIERFHVRPDRLDPEIVWSRDDGHTWNRSHPRPAFIERGAEGNFDSHWIALSASIPIEQNGQLWFYYGGRSCAHYGYDPHNDGAVGLATLRRDGFCSLFADELPAELITKPMVWPGGELALNYDPRPQPDTRSTALGEMAVEVQTPEGRPVEGFALADCALIPINTAFLPDCCQTVTWKNEACMDTLRGRTLRLRFKMRNAHLFSFKATPVT